MTETSVPTTHPPGKGWLPYVGSNPSPPDYVEVELWRAGWRSTQLSVPGENPWMNVYGLYWRPAGPMLTEKARDEWLIKRMQKK